MPEVFLWADDQGGCFVVVEGTQADEVVAVWLEADAARFGQPRQLDILLEPG